MIANGEQVIFNRFLFTFLFTIVRQRMVEDILAEVKSFNREFDKPASTTKLRRVLTLDESLVTLPLESLEVNQQDLWCFVYLHLLLGQDKVFTVGTVPSVVFLQSLWLSSQPQTVIDVQLFGCHVIVAWFTKHSIFTSGEVFNLLKGTLDNIGILAPIDFDLQLCFVLRLLALFPELFDSDGIIEGQWATIAASLVAIGADIVR